MIITIPPWDALVAEFGLDSDGDISTTSTCLWFIEDDALLSSDRTIEIIDTPDKDGDYSIIDPRFNVGYLFKSIYTFCVEYTLKHSFGTSKFLRKPYGTN